MCQDSDEQGRNDLQAHEETAVEVRWHRAKARQHVRSSSRDGKALLNTSRHTHMKPFRAGNLLGWDDPEV